MGNSVVFLKLHIHTKLQAQLQFTRHFTYENTYSMMRSFDEFGFSENS